MTNRSRIETMQIFSGMDHYEASYVSSILDKYPHVAIFESDYNDDIDIRANDWCMKNLGGDDRFFYRGNGWQILIGREIVRNGRETGKYALVVCLEKEEYVPLLQLAI